MLTKFSEMNDTLIICRALACIKNYKVSKTDDKTMTVIEGRVALAKRQYKNLNTIESFRELEKCEVMAFK